MEDLLRRGLAPDKSYLFVLDGSKGLRSAVARAFGERAAVQRCQLHKRRNVKGHLPPEHQGAVDARIRAAYRMSDYHEAKKSLELTIRYLERLNPSAAASLREGLEETLTLHGLGIGDPLRRTLMSTNPIESCFSSSREMVRRVKRWRNCSQVMRWAASSLLAAERKFRRVRGYKHLPQLVTALEKRVDPQMEAA